MPNGTDQHNQRPPEDGDNVEKLFLHTVLHFCLLAVYVLMSYGLNELVKKFGPEDEFERFIFLVMQFMFGVATVLPCAIFVVGDLIDWITWLQNKIDRKR